LMEAEQVPLSALAATLGPCSRR